MLSVNFVSIYTLCIVYSIYTCIVYSIYSTLFICKHFVLYSRKSWAQFDMHLSACRINICRASADELCHVTQHVSALSLSLSPLSLSSLPISLSLLPVGVLAVLMPPPLHTFPLCQKMPQQEKCCRLQHAARTRATCNAQPGCRLY